MTLASSTGPLHASYDLVMLDLDGVVYVGPDAVPHAADSLGEVAVSGGALAYLTNNAGRPASTVAQHLRDLDMPVADDAEVVTSAQAVARLVAADLPSGSRVLVVGGPGLVEPLTAAGLVCVESADDDPAAVVQGFHPSVGWTRLAEASYAVAAGVPWYASNADLTVPTPRGVAPGNGSLVQVVANVTGSRPVVAGKPERPLFDETLRRTGARNPLMVGDRIDTDIDGANALGIASLVVLTGVSDVAGLAALEPGRRPSFVSPDLRGLLRPHHDVTLEPERARCAGATAVVADDVVRLQDEGDDPIAAVRALLGLAWSRRDDTGRAVQVQVPEGLG